MCSGVSAIEGRIGIQHIIDNTYLIGALVIDKKTSMELIAPNLDHGCIHHIVHVDTEVAVSCDGSVSVEEESTAISKDVAHLD